MFTGIVEAQGRIMSINRNSSLYQLEIKAPELIEGLQIGDSVATNGVCLTVSQLKKESFVADVMPKTLQMSSLGQLRVTSIVNLERALTLASRMGGHLVTGHIDATARLKHLLTDENATLLTFEADIKIINSLMPQGSIAIDGISLTLAEVDFRSFTVSIIPHTLKSTTLGRLKIGDFVNIETDVVGKYIKHFMNQGGEKACLSSAKLTAFLMD